MFSKLIINKFQNGEDTQTTEIVLKERFVNGHACRETIYSTWRIGKILPPIKEQRLTVDIIDNRCTNAIDFKAITKYIGDILKDSQLEIDNSDSNEITESKNKKKIDQISDFLIKKANGEVQNSSDNLSTDMLDINLGKICKNNELILKNIFILNEKLQYLKQKEMEENTIAKLANVSHVCEKCGSIFTKYATFQYHMKTHKLRGDAASKVREYRTLTTRSVNSKFSPVWVCPFCYQAWPTESHLQQHLFTSQCHAHLETETKMSLDMIINQAVKRHISQLMHCEFCEKLFTNITKVLKHQKEHRTDKNYQCFPCDGVFNGYSQVVEHWSTECHWKQHVYVFTQPKYLICNICYEKFESWNNLYLHRYEFEHFISKCKEKENTEDEEDENLVGKRGKRKKDIMKYESVLQCEGCGVVYSNEDELIHHREEIHLEKLCQICGQISDCKDEFIEHLKNHNQNESP